jgi:hypothetical protein
MMSKPTHSIPSLSGTFGIHTRLKLNPKMPKEPSSPSHANARTAKHCAKIETEILRNNKGQRTTRGIKHWGLSGYASILPRFMFSVTGQESSPQSPTVSYRKRWRSLEQPQQQHETLTDK